MQKVICLMGPTATGKTAIAVELCQQYPCDIVSVDSAMIYRGMDIGTAKPTSDILKIAPHRLIDISEPSERYSAAQFCHDANAEIENILKSHRIPLLVGGTMMYFNALQQGISDLPSADSAIRSAIENEATKVGWLAMHKKLETVDPIAAERIDVNDSQRIQRALEVCEITGTPMSTLWQESRIQPKYEFFNIALMPDDRNILHKRIQKRLLQMLEAGFIDEVQALKARGDLSTELPSIRTVGYRQIWQYLSGEFDKQTMQEKALVATRQLAKRQMTWLRHWPDVNCITCDDHFSTMNKVKSQLSNHV